MSDNFLSLVVPGESSKTDVIVLADIVIDWLQGRKVIEPRPTDCVLGRNKGYPPGAACKEIIERAEDHDFPKLGANGLEVTITREVFHTGQNGLDSVCCPDCNLNIIESDWGSLVHEWLADTGKDKLTCSQCAAVYSITEYNFTPAFGFGDLGFTFWNWPPLSDVFIQDVELLICKPLVVVHGRL